MTVAVPVALILVAVIATVFVARASVAIVQMRRDVASLRKQTKQMLTNAQRTEATAKRILDRAYRYQEQIDVLMLDPKVQAALNRHEGV